ncbi:MAG: hypothetical protein HOW73_27340 [Polyangiaceae bacterium]|nr:hypothetical protein [Polyangiaceae bacterium]
MDQQRKQQRDENNEAVSIDESGGDRHQCAKREAGLTSTRMRIRIRTDIREMGWVGPI